MKKQCTKRAGDLPGGSTAKPGELPLPLTLPLQLNKKCGDYEDDDEEEEDVASAIATCAVSLRRLCAWPGEREREQERRCSVPHYFLCIHPV